MPRILGVLGGMGPLATVDFMDKVISATPASRDQDHVPMVAASVPQVPDRTAAIEGDGPSPLPAMLDGIRRLERGGAESIAIACNTAHYWYDEMQAETELPIFHIADMAIQTLDEGVAHVGILATAGTISAGIYADRLTAAGMAAVVPDDADQNALVMGGINAVKAGDVAAGGDLLAKAADALRAKGAERIILGCTEVPPGLAAADEMRDDCVDATDALARACVDWAMVDKADALKTA